jgi:hypothetical protein
MVPLHPLRGGLKCGACVDSDAISRGSLWGQLMWGTYWTWDAHLNSFLLLFFLYIGQLALLNAFDEPAGTNRLRDSPAIYRRRATAECQSPSTPNRSLEKRIVSC